MVIRISLIFLFLVLAAYGQQQERVAIIQTVDDRDSIGISELAYLTDRLRETAVNVLPKQQYGVMTTESIVAFLGSQERAQKECREASCLADLGRKVNADYVAQARLGRFSGNLTIKTELYKVKSGNLIGSFTGNSKNIFDLLNLIDEKAPALFKNMMDSPSDSKASPVVTPTPIPAPVPIQIEQEPYALTPAPTPVQEKPYVPKPEVEKSGGASFWVAIGLDVIGVAAISVGYIANENMKKEYDKYSKLGPDPNHGYKKAWEEVEDRRSERNLFYIIGGAALASGIAVHIWF